MMSTPEPPEVRYNDQGIPFYRDGDKWLPMPPAPMQPARPMKVGGSVNAAAVIFIIMAVLGVIGVGIYAVDHNNQNTRDIEQSCANAVNDGFDICK